MTSSLSPESSRESHKKEGEVNTLEDLFLLNPPALGYLYDRIGTEYQENPSNFADVFFDLVEQMNPKSVRIVCYQLLSLGTHLETLYNQRTVEDVPEFLYRLNTFPNETILVLLKYGFPPYPGGSHYLWYSLSEFASSSLSRTINRLNWLDFNLDLNVLLNLDLNHLNQDGQTLLQSAIQRGLTSVVIKLLMRKANPNIITKDGQTTLDLILDLVDQNDIQGTLSNLLLIIKQLVRYGLEVGNYQQPLNQDKVERAINSGRRLSPSYITELPPYLEADRIEDLTLMSVIDPSTIDTEELKPETREKFLESIKRVQDQTIVSSDGTIIAWPKAVDASHDRDIMGECPIEQLTVESPFKPDEVYALALRGLPDVRRVPSATVFPLARETTTSNEQIYRFPQSTAKVGFMGLPPLIFNDPQPSIESIRRWPGPISAIFERTNDPDGFVQSIPRDELIVERGFSSPSLSKTAPDSDLVALLPLATGPIRPTATPSLPTLPIPAY